jgi:outer membrane protein assembly factor BamB
LLLEFCVDSRSIVGTRSVLPGQVLRLAKLGLHPAKEEIMHRLCFVSLIAVAAAAPTVAGQEAPKPLQQWPHWRGPLASGAAPHADPPIHWDEETNVKWKSPLPGRGSSTPIVWRDHVFVATAIDTGRVAPAAELPKVDLNLKRKTEPPKTYHQFVLICFDRQTGKVRWQKTACERVPHEGRHPTHSYAAGSPTTDGKLVWVSFGSRGIYCYDLAGTLQWERDLGLLHTRYAWGEASTPVLHGDDLVLNWDQEVQSRLIVLDAHSGKTRWQVDRDEETTWNTPLVVEHKGKTQVIVNGTNRVRSYDLATGKVLWQCGGQTILPIPSPVAAEGMAYCMSGYTGSAAVAVPLDVTGDITGTATVAWKHTKGTPYVPSPLLVDGKLYFTQANGNLLTCLDARTGKPLIDRERLPGVTTFYASPVAGSGRIYLVDREGVTLVLKQSAKVEVLATNRLSDTIDASPALAGRQLFLRGHKYLYCLEAP